MKNVKSLKTERSKINESCLEVCESITALAHSEQLTGFAFVAVNSNGEIITEHSDSLHAPTLIGAITILQNQLIQEVKSYE